MPHTEIIDLEAEEDRWEENRKTIKDTYRQVWHQFYDWEPEFAAATIASLNARAPSLDIPLARWEPSYFLGDDDDSDDDKLDFVLLDFENGGTESIIGCKEVDIQSTVKPHPKYESVAPSSCNMYVLMTIVLFASSNTEANLVSMNWSISNHFQRIQTLNGRTQCRFMTLMVCC